MRGNTAEMTKTNTHFEDVLRSDGLMLEPVATLKAYQLFYEKGHKIALADALRYWNEVVRKFLNGNQIELLSKSLPMPNWMLEGLILTISATYEGKGEKLGKGAGGNSNAAFKNNQHHLMRYLAVQEARKCKDGTGKLLKGDAALKCAEEILKDSSAVGTVTIDAIKKSFRKVRKEIASPTTWHKYYPLKSDLGGIKIGKKGKNSRFKFLDFSGIKWNKRLSKSIARSHYHATYIHASTSCSEFFCIFRYPRWPR